LKFSTVKQAIVELADDVVGGLDGQFIEVVIVWTASYSPNGCGTVQADEHQFFDKVEPRFVSSFI
jgi:hypothetical protein